MKKMRFGGYEVMPDGTKPRKGKVLDRTSDDGRALRHCGKYYGSYGHAARALHDMLLEQGIDNPAVASVADAIEAAREAFRPVSDEIDRMGASA